MKPRWVGPDKVEIEHIVLNGRELLRVRKYGFLVAYAGSVRELQAHVDLADLVEVVTLTDRRNSP
ncbi:transposase [Sphaerisporangium sp. NPDC004334]